MVASVPEDTSRTCSIDGTSLQISSAMAISASVGAPNEKLWAAVSCTARTTSGWAWPTIIGPQEPM
ncbi:hypothetical protein D3C72_1716550 [compost metagenome]